MIELIANSSLEDRPGDAHLADHATYAVKPTNGCVPVGHCYRVKRWGNISEPVIMEHEKCRTADF